MPGIIVILSMQVLLLWSWAQRLRGLRVFGVSALGLRLQVWFRVKRSARLQGEKGFWGFPSAGSVGFRVQRCWTRIQRRCRGRTQSIASCIPAGL